MNCRISIAVCTWNRSALLRDTLEQMTQMAVPDGLSWEVLVVNNNCTDDTDQVIAAFADRLPLRRIFQPIPGLSNARNAAVDAARGELILWTDDDVLVGRNWLSAYADAIERYPDAVFFGGPIEPLFEGRPPAWLIQSWQGYASAFAVRDLGSEDFEISGVASQTPFGANYALRTVAQRAHRYDPGLGRKAGAPLVGGEEVAIMRALLSGGLVGQWLAAARVQHRIEPQRQTVRYLRRYFEGQGVTNALQTKARPHPHIFSVPRYRLRMAVAAELRYRLSRAFRSPAIWTKDLMQSAQHWGFLGAYRKAKVTTDSQHRMP